MALLKKQETICQQLGDRDGMARCHYNMALIFEQQGDIDTARRLATDALASLREMNMPRETAMVQKLLEAIGPRLPSV